MIGTGQAPWRLWQAYNCQIEAGQHVDAVLVLGDCQRALLSIVVDFDTQNLCGRPQIAQFEVFGEISDGLLDCIKRLWYKGHIIHKDRQDDLDITSSKNIDSSIRICLFEAQGFESGVHLVIPPVFTLFGAIWHFFEQTHYLLAISLFKALWLLHIDIPVHFAIEICIWDINRPEMEVVDGCKCKDDA